MMLKVRSECTHVLTNARDLDDLMRRGFGDERRDESVGVVVNTAIDVREPENRCMQRPGLLIVFDP